MKKASLLTLGISAISFCALAGGFYLPHQGIDQLSMGGVGTAYPFNAASMYYNPALLSRMNNFQINGNISFVQPELRYISAYGPTQHDNLSKMSYPTSFYIGGKVNPESRLGFGIGVFSPFAQRIDWGKQWIGRYLVQELSLNTTFIQPTISYKISDVVSIGAGFDYVLGSLDMTKALPYSTSSMEAQAHLDGQLRGMGYNLGLSIVPTDDLSIGINYRSGVNLKVDKGVAQFNVPNSISSLLPNTNFNSELKLPHIISLGVAGKLSHNVVLTGDLVYSSWSRLNSTNVDYEINTPLLEDETHELNYKDNIAIRLGAQYSFHHDLKFMAGVFYDQTPTKDDYVSPAFFDGNKWGYSLGVSYEPISKLKLSAGLSYTYIAEREVQYLPANFSGTYQQKSLTPALGVTYKFID